MGGFPWRSRLHAGSVACPSRFAGPRYMRRRRADPENAPRRLCGVARSLVAHNRRLCRVLDAPPARHVFDHDDARLHTPRLAEVESQAGSPHPPSPPWSHRHPRPPPRRNRPIPHRPRLSRRSTRPHLPTQVRPILARPRPLHRKPSRRRRLLRRRRPLNRQRRNHQQRAPPRRRRSPPAPSHHRRRRSQRQR